jgi:hypothetical protein
MQKIRKIFAEKILKNNRAKELNKIMWKKIMEILLEKNCVKEFPKKFRTE